MKIKEKILLIEDERTIRGFMQAILTANGYDVLMAGTGAMANTMISSHCPDLIILDLGLPDMDGMTILRSVREWSKVPILVVSARSHERDKVEALDAGADDYVTKPFSVPELMARVKTNLRRAPEITPTKELVFEDIRMDLVEKKVFRGENYIHLGPTEFRLLKMLLETPGKVFSRETLLKTVWGDNIYVESRTVDVHIRRLRKSLNDFGPDYIRTVRATGYAIDINPVGDQEEPADN